MAHAQDPVCGMEWNGTQSLSLSKLATLPLKGALYDGHARGTLVIQVTQHLWALATPAGHMPDTPLQGREQQLEALQLRLQVGEGEVGLPEALWVGVAASWSQHS